MIFGIVEILFTKSDSFFFLGSPGLSWALLGSPGLPGLAWTRLGSPGLSCGSRAPLGSWTLLVSPGDPGLSWAPLDLWARLGSLGSAEADRGSSPKTITFT